MGRPYFIGCFQLPPGVQKGCIKMVFSQTLCWILGQQALNYKQPGGTRSVSHEIIAPDVHFKNLKVMLVFSNEQVEVPYNAMMRKDMARIEGIRRGKWFKAAAISSLKKGYNGLHCSLLIDFGKGNIGYPEAITAIERAVKTLSKISMYLSSKGIKWFTFRQQRSPHYIFIFTTLQEVNTEVLLTFLTDHSHIFIS